MIGNTVLAIFILGLKLEFEALRVNALPTGYKLCPQEDGILYTGELSNYFWIDDVPDIEACIEKCKAEENCKGYSFNTQSNGRVCEILRTIDGQIQDRAYISGLTASSSQQCPSNYPAVPLGRLSIKGEVVDWSTGNDPVKVVENSALRSEPEETRDHSSFDHLQIRGDSTFGKVLEVYSHPKDSNDDSGNNDVSRTEIKGGKKSDDSVKGKKGDTMKYHWWFNLYKGLDRGSDRFTHIFQLKGYGKGTDSFPLATITLKKDALNFQYKEDEDDKDADVIVKELAKLKDIDGEWLECLVTAKFDSKDGYLKIQINNRNGVTLAFFKSADIHSWWDKVEFVRPKFGIYRYTKGRDLPSESILRLSDITIGKNN